MAPQPRTRIKICGLRELQHALFAARAGADAIGLVFYPPSPRYIEPAAAARITRGLPAFVESVALFVNPTPALVTEVIRSAAPSLLQFHGDETAEFCETFDRPYIKAARMGPGIDLLQFGARFSSAAALLLDAHVEGYGGSGVSFDWSLIPPGLSLPIILSGGLDPHNVGVAIRRVRPWAVDVSSGVEAARGVKDLTKIAAFIQGVRDADV
jgi:phosphoribosylanthranilate isomerase